MKICVFDTETTGLLRPSPTKIELQPYIIELYACWIDEEFDFIYSFESMFSIPIELPPEIPKITGITDDMLIGKPSFISSYRHLAKKMTGTDVIVAHNLPFDIGMLRTELIRNDLETRFPWPRHNICTVEQSMPIKGRRLRLDELHDIATGGRKFNAHRAKDDVHALIRSFKYLCDDGYVSLEDYQN